MAFARCDRHLGFVCAYYTTLHRNAPENVTMSVPANSGIQKAIKLTVKGAKMCLHPVIRSKGRLWGVLLAALLGCVWLVWEAHRHWQHPAHKPRPFICPYHHGLFFLPAHVAISHIHCASSPEHVRQMSICTLGDITQLVWQEDNCTNLLLPPSLSLSLFLSATHV